MQLTEFWNFEKPNERLWKDFSIRLNDFQCRLLPIAIKNRETLRIQHFSDDFFEEFVKKLVFQGDNKGNLFSRKALLHDFLHFPRHQSLSDSFPNSCHPGGQECFHAFWKSLKQPVFKYILQQIIGFFAREQWQKRKRQFSGHYFSMESCDSVYQSPIADFSDKSLEDVARGEDEVTEAGDLGNIFSDRRFVHKSIKKICFFDLKKKFFFYFSKKFINLQNKFFFSSI